MKVNAIRDGIVKIADFGASAVFRDHEEMRKLIGTVSYMAPEVFRRCAHMSFPHEYTVLWCRASSS